MKRLVTLTTVIKFEVCPGKLSLKSCKRGYMRLKNTRSILVVDSNPDISGLLKIELEGKGMAVTLRDNVETALESLKHSRPDLLLIHVDVAPKRSANPTNHLVGPITDAALPRMSPDDFAKLICHLKSQPELAKTPVMIMTEERLEYVPNKIQKDATKIVRLFTDFWYHIADEIKRALDGPVLAGASL